MKLRSAFFVFVLLLLTVSICAAQAPFGISPTEFCSKYALIYSLYDSGASCDIDAGDEENGARVGISDDIYLKVYYADNDVNHVDVYVITGTDDPDIETKFSSAMMSTFSMLSWGMGNYTADWDTETVSGYLSDLMSDNSSVDFCGFTIKMDDEDVDGAAAAVYRITKNEDASASDSSADTAADTSSTDSSSSSSSSSSGSSSSSSSSGSSSSSSSSDSSSSSSSSDSQSSYSEGELAFFSTLDDLVAKNVIPEGGSYSDLEDYTDEWAQINWYQWNRLAKLRNFVFSANVSWESAHERPNTFSAGCGLVFRENGTDNMLEVSLRMDGYVYMDGYRSGTPLSYPKAGYGSSQIKAAHQFVVVANGGIVTVYVDGVQEARWTDVAIKDEGYMGLATMSGTNKGFGTRCEWTDIYYYTWN